MQELRASQLQSDLMMQLTTVTKKSAMSEAICEDLFRFYGLPISFSEEALSDLRARLQRTLKRECHRNQLIQQVELDFSQLKQCIARMKQTLEKEFNFAPVLLEANTKTASMEHLSALLGGSLTEMPYSDFATKHLEERDALFILKGSLITQVISSFCSVSGMYQCFSVGLYGVQDLVDLKHRDIGTLTHVKVSLPADIKRYQQFVCEQIYKHKNLAVIREVEGNRVVVLCGQVESVLGKIKMEFEHRYLVNV